MANISGKTFKASSPNYQGKGSLNHYRRAGWWSICGFTTLLFPFLIQLDATRPSSPLNGGRLAAVGQPERRRSEESRGLRNAQLFFAQDDAGRFHSADDKVWAVAVVGGHGEARGWES